MLERFRTDILHALRGLRAGRPTLAAAVLTLGAVIGLNVAIFGVVDRALLSPPAHLARPHELFAVGFEAPGGRGVMTTTSYVAFRTLRDEVPSIAGAAAWQAGPTSLTIDGEQVEADTLLVSGSYFEVLGAHPLRGRGIAAGDDAAAAAIAVVSHAFWQAAFGGDAAVLGRRLVLRGIEYEVAGVMRRGFSGHSAASVDVWLPMATARRADTGWDRDPFRNIVSVVARVGSDVNRAAATSQASSALRRTVVLTGLAGGGVGATERRIASWLIGVSLFVLLIGLANAATLLLVHGARRRREQAVRAALGATRARLLRLGLIEAAILALAATAASLIAGYWMDEAVRAVLMPGLISTTGLSARTLLAAAAAGIVAALVAFAASAYCLPPKDGGGGLREQLASGRPRAQRGVLLVQTSVTVLLLACAGLFGRSLYNLVEQDFGMHMESVLIVGFERGSGAVQDQDEIYRAALDRIRALPGVEVATVIRSLPFGSFHVPPIGVPGHAEPPSVDGQLPFLIAATPELFDILGVTVVEGRRFAAGDDRGELVVIVNQTMARTVWPGESALGKCIRIGFDDAFDPFTATGPPVPSAAVPCRRVVGVARDVRQRSVVPTGNENRLMQYYVPFGQVPGPPAGMEPGPAIGGLLVRTATDPSALVAPVRRLVTSGRADLPQVDVRPYEDLLALQVRPWRMGTSLLLLLGALALAVAAMGLYAAFAHAVAERRREMAIRVAIGASPAGVVSMILREAALLTAAGVVVGTAGAVVAARSLRSMLFGIGPADPLALALAAALMLTVALAATIVPARTASRADPGSLLRVE